MIIVTKRRLVGLGAAALSAAAFAAPAQAGIGANPNDRGPRTERFGFFPEYYTDSSGTSLQLCIDLAATCGAVALPNPAAPISFPGNFPDEMFYFSADATLGTKIGLTLAQEATFAAATPGGVPVDGNQAVFGRVRITDRGDELVAGQWYRFTTPYGQFDAVGGGKNPGAQVVSQDVGCGAAGCLDDADFGTVGGSSIGPDFLRSLDPSVPAGFIGDGATDAPVTGSAFVPAADSINPPDSCDPVADPTCTPATPDPDTGLPANYFRIDRITTPTPGNPSTVIGTFAETKDFVVTGKLADPPPGLPWLLSSPGDAGVQPIADGAKPLTVKVRNGGSADLKLAAGGASIVDDPGANFSITDNQCDNETVNPAGHNQDPTVNGSFCNVVIAFDPTTAGAKTAKLHITEQAGGAVHDIALSGVGTKPVLGTDQGGLSFGVQTVGTTAATMTATVRNVGNAPLLVNGATLSGSEVADYEIVASDCSGTTLAPNATCTVDVHFTPKGTSVRNASLDIASAAGNKSLSLSGIGSAAAQGPNTVIIQQQVPATGAAAGAGGGGGGALTGSGATETTLPKLTLKRLGMARRVRLATARTQGIRMNMELTPGTEVVKIEVFRRGGGKLTLLSSGFKAPGRSGRYTVRQSHAALRKLLRRGLYEIHVTPGRSKTDLGTMSKYAFTVI